MHISILQHNSSSDPYSYILESHRKTSIMVTPRQVPPPPIPKLETIFVVTTISRRLETSFFHKPADYSSTKLTFDVKSFDNFKTAALLLYTLFFIFFLLKNALDTLIHFSRGRSMKAGVFLLHRKYFCVCC